MCEYQSQIAGKSTAGRAARIARFIPKLIHVLVKMHEKRLLELFTTAAKFFNLLLNDYLTIAKAKAVIEPALHLAVLFEIWESINWFKEVEMVVDNASLVGTCYESLEEFEIACVWYERFLSMYCDRCKESDETVLIQLERIRRQQLRAKVQAFMNVKFELPFKDKASLVNFACTYRNETRDPMKRLRYKPKEEMLDPGVQALVQIFNLVEDFWSRSNSNLLQFNSLVSFCDFFWSRYRTETTMHELIFDHFYDSAVQLLNQTENIHDICLVDLGNFVRLLYRKADARFLKTAELALKVLGKHESDFAEDFKRDILRWTCLKKLVNRLGAAHFNPTEPNSSSVFENLKSIVSATLNAFEGSIPIDVDFCRTFAFALQMLVKCTSNIVCRVRLGTESYLVAEFLRDVQLLRLFERILELALPRTTTISKRLFALLDGVASVYEAIEDFEASEKTYLLGLNLVQKLRMDLSNESSTYNGLKRSSGFLKNLETDLWCSYCRQCILKCQYSGKEQTFESLADDLCKNDHSRRSLFWLALSSCENKRGAEYVEKAATEFKNAQIIRKKESDFEAEIILCRRWNSRIVLEIKPFEKAAWCQVFCHKGTLGAVSVNDTAYPGTGIFYPIDKENSTYCVVRELESHIRYQVAVAYYDQGDYSI